MPMQIKCFLLVIVVERDAREFGGEGTHACCAVRHSARFKNPRKVFVTVSFSVLQLTG